MSESAAKWEQEGRALFANCEFGGAVRAFRRAAALQPGNAELQFWLGRSYERIAEVSSPLTASRSAHKSERSLKRAMQLDPKNQTYILELFDLYVYWPEWFSRAPARASELLERIRSASPEDDATLRMQVAVARQEVTGLDAGYRGVILLPWRIIGHLVP